MHYSPRNTTLFIARKLHFDQNDGRRMSRPAVRVATLGIAVGLAVMICAVAVVVGFKREVGEQVIGFGSHIQITNYNFSDNLQTASIVTNDSMLMSFASVPHVTRVQRVATLPGIVKTASDFEGVMLKGVGADYDTTFFAQHLIAGTMPIFSDSTTTNNVLISKQIATLLQLELGERFSVYFAGERLRARRFTICGIYETTFGDFDKTFILADIRHVQRLNNWADDEVGQLELLVDDFGKIDQIERDVFLATAALDGDNYWLRTQSIKKVMPNMFDWLDMLDINAWVVLVLMILVAGFNIVSGLLIIILERTNTIGILKALGATDWTIRKIFLYQAAFLVLKGMFWGNVVGCLLVTVEHFFHLIPLDAATYYVNYVPVSLSFGAWLLLNLGTLATILLVLLVPSHLITKIQPAKAIKFD